MTRSELIESLTLKHSGLTPAQIEAAVKHIFEYMVSSLENGLRIEIRGFGSFSLRYRLSRIARNPKTGDHVVTDGKYALHFKPGKELRDRVNVARANGVVAELSD